MEDSGGVGEVSLDLEAMTVSSPGGERFRARGRVRRPWAYLMD